MASCCLHSITQFNKDDVLLKFTESRWSTTIASSQKWARLDGEEKIIAEKFESMCQQPETALCHETCYRRFNNNRRIQQAEIRIQKHKTTGFETQKRPLRQRSSSEPPCRRRHILPESQCIICRKERRLRIDKPSGKRLPEKLVQGGPNADRFYEAAVTLQREDILRDINYKSDLLSVEAKYHKSCYRDFLNKSAKSSIADKVEQSRPFQKAFEALCKDVVEPLMQKQGKMMTIRRLTKIFKKKAMQEGGVAISHTYKTSYLKSRLKGCYPDMVFVSQKQKNKPQVAFFAKESVVIDYEDFSDGTDSDSEESYDSDTENKRTDVGHTCDEHAETQQSRFEDGQWREIYLCSLAVRNAMQEAPKFTSWPPEQDTTSVEKILEVVPAELFNFIAWICGLSEEFDMGHVHVKENHKLKILAIAQDILSLSNQKYILPKQILLGMAVRHVTGSERIVNILHGLGHGVSSSTLQRLDTDIAAEELQNAVPSTLESNKFTTVVYDNIDFLEETISGQNTTHCVNGIAIQNSKPRSKTSDTDQVMCRKSRKRALQPVATEIVHFHKRRRPDPQVMLDQRDTTDEDAAREYAEKKDAGFFFLKSQHAESGEGDLLPSWTGFNTKIQKEVPTASSITYLPVLDGNATDMSTINTLLYRSIDLANHLHLQEIAVVADLAIYSKAQIIRWGNPDFTSRIVMRLGEFHTVMSFMGAIGKRFEQSGLEEILLESGAVAGGSMNGVMSGHHYNRAVRAHKLLAEAMERLRWHAFLRAQSDEDQGVIRAAVETWASQWPVSFEETLEDPRFKQILAGFQQQNRENCAKSVTYRFWSSYIDMVQAMLCFLRATREGNWQLHLASVRNMLPWFFAMDKVNYSRYLTLYYHEMKCLPQTHPTAFHHFSAGEFSVQRQTTYGFARVACDQTIEQTINRDAKSKSGWVGFSLKKGAVFRWIMGSHARGLLTRQCEVLAGKSTDQQRLRKDLEPANIIRIEEMIASIQNFVESRINPFTVQADGLVNICSGAFATQEVSDDLVTAQEIGERSLQKFVEERVRDKIKSVFEPLKATKLRTFSKSVKKSSTKDSSPKSALQNSNLLLSRLLSIAQVKPIDVEQILTHALADIPPALGNPDESMTKTNKSDMLRLIKEDVPDIETEGPTASVAVVLDGMVLLRQLAVPQTFGALAAAVFDNVVSKATSEGAERVDIVWDTYPQHSIKSCEHKKRMDAVGVQVFHLTSGNQKTPKHWHQYLNSGKNKEMLIDFLYQQWHNAAYAGKLGRLKMIFAHSNTCHMFTDNGDEVSVVPVPALFSDHIEADTRLLLHAQHAGQEYSNIIISSPDTDVFLLVISCLQSIDAHLFVRLSATSLCDVTRVKAVYSEEICSALVGLHCYTGCDSISSFRGKGKKSALSVLKKYPELATIFAQLGLDWTPSERLIAELERFVCLLYGCKLETDINRVRAQLFRKKGSSQPSLPPNKDSLHLHTLRASYQAAMYRRCLEKDICAPSPLKHGWTEKNGALVIKWMSIPALPPEITDLVTCKCKTGCAGNRCPCKRATPSLLCTCLCYCQNCVNTSNEEDNEESEVEVESGSESDSEEEGWLSD